MTWHAVIIGIGLLALSLSLLELNRRIQVLEYWNAVDQCEEFTERYWRGEDKAERLAACRP